MFILVVEVKYVCNLEDRIKSLNAYHMAKIRSHGRQTYVNLITAVNTVFKQVDKIFSTLCKSYFEEVVLGPLLP